MHVRLWGVEKLITVSKLAQRHNKAENKMHPCKERTVESAITIFGDKTDANAVIPFFHNSFNIL